MGNFIDNAIKYTADQPEPQIQIRASKSGDAWRFLVKDNGIGFDPVYHDRIFDIFQRLHRPEDFPGTGVGLALAKKAASRLNGNVWANGMPGRGATFYLEIPEPELLKRNTAEGALNGKK
jgi:light-regulated signal transduction histidine kinase (bacteriophytochrome)